MGSYRKEKMKREQKILKLLESHLNITEDNHRKEMNDRFKESNETAFKNYKG